MALSKNLKTLWISSHLIYCTCVFNNPSSAELSYLIFHPLEDVPRYRDPQLHVVQTKHLQIFMFEHYLKQQFIQNNSVYSKQQ